MNDGSAVEITKDPEFFDLEEKELSTDKKESFMSRELLGSRPVNSSSLVQHKIHKDLKSDSFISPTESKMPHKPLMDVEMNEMRDSISG